MQKLLSFILIPLLVVLMSSPSFSEEYISFQDPVTGKVISPPANLRSGPGLNERILEKITQKGVSFKVLGKEGNWFKVKKGDLEAWVYKTKLTLEKVEGESKEDSSVGLLVEKIVFDGDPPVDKAILQKAVEPYQNRELSIEEMGEVAALVTATYHEKGFKNAKAYLPEQDISSGILRIGVLMKEAVAEKEAPAEEEVVAEVKKEAAEEEESAEKMVVAKAEDEEVSEEVSEEADEDEEVDEYDEDEEEEAAGVVITEILFEGNTVIETIDLQKAVESFKNKELTIEEMGELADLITMKYQEEGYILARAYLPEQEITSGILKIAVAEGNIGKIIIAGAKHYKEDIIKRYFKQQIKHGIVKEQLLEKGLLLANEVPKVKTGVVLKEGAKPGEVDIILNTKDDSALTFGMDINFDFNNYGSDLVSEDRYGTTMNFYDHNWGSILSVRGSFGHTADDSTLIKADYSLPVGIYGTKIRLNYLNGNYVVGQELVDLEASGRTKIYGGSVVQPILMKKNMNLSFTFKYDRKKSESKLLDALSSRDRVELFTSTLNWDNVDRFLGKNIASFAIAAGVVHPDDILPAGRQDVEEKFQRYGLNLVRIQRLFGSTNLLARLSGQYTENRLPSMEQMAIGGMGTARGYDPSIFVGDYGYTFSTELMLGLPDVVGKKVFFGQRLSQMFQFILFFDYSTAFKNRYLEAQDGTDTQGTGLESDYLAGYGGGLRFFYKDRISFKYDLGFPRHQRHASGSPELINYFMFTCNFF